MTSIRSIPAENPEKIHRQRSALAEPAAPAAPAAGEPAADIPDTLMMRDDLNLKQVLAEMLHRNQQTLQVHDAESRILVIRYAVLVRHLQEVSGGFGVPIIAGIRTYDPVMVVQGSVPVWKLTGFCCKI